MHFNVYGVLCSQCSYLHISATTVATFRVILLQLTTFVSMYSSNNNITLRMATILTETCL
jgi:hypothetical protein